MRDDEAMRDMVESIKQYGVLSPAIARPMPDGGYELVSGHRRKRACELAGLETMPVIVRELDDDAAAILVVDSNLQREGLLPSERAFAYKLKMEALRHQGERTDLTSRQVVGKLEAADIIGELNESITHSIPAPTRSEMNEATESVREQIEYDLIIGEDGYDAELVDEAVAQMVEAICSTKPNIRVAGENRSADVVRSRLLELNRFHVEFVLDCMRENTTEIEECCL